MISQVAFVILPIFFTLCVVRKYRERQWGRCKSTSPLTGKVFLITGSNSGIGKETARSLAQRNACVIMACRDVNRANDAVQEIRRSTHSGQLVPMHLDLASFKSIEKFARDVLEKFPQIHVLINNAGVYFPLSSNDKTEDGYEMNFGVNHLGHFLLTNLLVKRIKDSSPSRIVIVSSGLHERGQLDLNDLNMEKRKTGTTKSRINAGYCASKLANVYHARELAERLKGSGVDVFALCPGFTFTNLFRHSSFRWWQYVAFLPIAFLYMRSSTSGAQTVLHCATEESLAGKSGGFYRNCQPYQSTVDFNAEIQNELWEKSEGLTGQKFPFI